MSRLILGAGDNLKHDYQWVISNKISETKQFQAMFGATLRAIAVLYN